MRAKNSEIKNSALAVSTMAGPAGRLAAQERLNPSQAQSAPESAASSRMPGSVRAQQRAATAGSIITPTAISVPSTWKPRHQIKHQQRQKQSMQQRGKAGVVHLQPGAVERLADQTAVAQRNAQQRQAGDAADKQRRVTIDRQNRAK